jgi:hypothetical protein
MDKAIELCLHTSRQILHYSLSPPAGTSAVLDLGKCIVGEGSICTVLIGVMCVSGGVHDILANAVRSCEGGTVEDERVVRDAVRGRMYCLRNFPTDLTSASSWSSSSLALALLIDSKESLAIIVSRVEAAMGKDDRMEEKVSVGAGEDEGDGDVVERMCLDMGGIILVDVSDDGYGSGLDGGGKYDN